jgi:hypothetical protein
MLEIYLYHVRAKEFIVKFTREYNNNFKIPNIDTNCNIVSVTFYQQWLLAVTR